MTYQLQLAFLLFCVAALIFSVYTLNQIKRIQRPKMMTAEELIAPGGPLAPKPNADNTEAELARAAKKVPKPKLKVWRDVERGFADLIGLITDLKAEGFVPDMDSLDKLSELNHQYKKVELTIVALGEIGMHGVTETAYFARVETLGYQVLMPAPRPTRGDELGGRPNPNPLYYADARIIIARGE